MVWFVFFGGGGEVYHFFLSVFFSLFSWDSWGRFKDPAKGSLERISISLPVPLPLLPSPGVLNWMWIFAIRKDLQPGRVTTVRGIPWNPQESHRISKHTLQRGRDRRNDSFHFICFPNRMRQREGSWGIFKNPAIMRIIVKRHDDVTVGGTEYTGRIGISFHLTAEWVWGGARRRRKPWGNLKNPKIMPKHLQVLLSIKYG